MRSNCIALALGWVRIKRDKKVPAGHTWSLKWSSISSASVSIELRCRCCSSRFFRLVVGVSSDGLVSFVLRTKKKSIYSRNPNGQKRGGKRQLTSNRFVAPSLVTHSKSHRSDLASNRWPANRTTGRWKYLSLAFPLNTATADPISQSIYALHWH